MNRFVFRNLLPVFALVILSLIPALGPKYSFDHHGKIEILYCLSSVLLLLTAIAGWGNIFYRKTQSSPLFTASYLNRWITGSIFFFFLFYLFSVLQTVSFIRENLLTQILTLIICSIGSFFFFKTTLIQKNKLSPETWISLLPFLIVVVSRLFAAFNPSPHGDPLYYHLLASKHWMDGFHTREMALSSPYDLMTGYFEYYYFGLFQILNVKSGFNLIHGQISAQILHLLWPITTILILTFVLLKKLELRRHWGFLIVTILLGTHSLKHLGHIAKNDWAAAALFLSSCGLIYLRQWTLAGITTGIAVATKSNVVISMMTPALYLIYLVLKKELSVSNLFRFTLFSILATAPIFIRNGYYLGSPFFPAAIDLFASHHLSETILEGHRLIENPYGVKSFPKLNELLQYCNDNYFSYLVLLGFFIFKQTTSSLAKFKTVFFYLISAFICNYIAFRFLLPGGDPRFISPLTLSLVLMGLLITTTLWTQKAKSTPRFVQILISGLVVGFCSPPLYQLKRFFKDQQSLDLKIQHHTQGPLKQEIAQLYCTQNAKILLINSNELYYLSQCQSRLLSYNRKMENLLIEGNFSALVDFIKNNQFQYLVYENQNRPTHPISNQVPRQLKLVQHQIPEFIHFLKQNHFPVIKTITNFEIIAL